MSPLFDLHAHTNVSDGVLTPMGLVQRAASASVTALAVTDHDTVEGVDEARQAGEQLGVEIIPGVEISAYFGDTAIHVLGLFIEYREPWLRAFFAEAKRRRVDRVHKMVARLRELDVDIDAEDVMARSTHGTVGRPHVARTLVERGVVKTLQEAFDKYLRDDGPAYIGYDRVDLSEALELIHRAGGVSSLAHPIVMKDDSLIAPMAADGLMGLEVFHADHHEKKVAEYAAFADTLGLLVTGGSDFHAPDGIGRGELGCPSLTDEHMEKIRASVASI